MDHDDKPQVTEYLANEQTYLAWLRTGVEVMAFGFVAIKFALFASKIVGILLVGVGAAMILLAYFRFRKTMTQLKKGKFNYSGTFVAVTAVVIFVISTALLYCLLDSKKSNPKAEKTESEY